ncbi:MULTISPECIES: hypothetical protein [Actinoplanes]|uniref:hypothetical protein n=1 Tax=Actinoplanes TaxID=1865 RepID=UPI0005F2F9D7|nr:MULTISPECIES: hypothetical protein [Actinoplanes]GLY05320.1 hypothetical protein Acsp01_56990 [Actinoplanes sp. NBRC 101535]
MVTRRILLGTAAGAGLATLGAVSPAAAAAPTKSANGWRIDPRAVSTHRIAGSAASVAIRTGDVAAVLLHVARRWHYEIAPLDSGEGGGVIGHLTTVTAGADFESNHLSGTALALHPTAYPLAGSETLWPHHEAIVRDILLDCAGTVVWGGDLLPAKASHFAIGVPPGEKTLRAIAERLATGNGQIETRAQTAGTVADPATPARRSRARALPRPR